MKLVVVYLCIIVLSASTAAAQAPVSPFGVRATSISEGDPEVDQLEREISEIIRDQLRDRGIASHGKIQVTILVDAVSDAVSGRVVLSLTSMNRLPQEVIELGAKKEAFYLSWDGDALPEEGVLVRQHMSRDWLTQFHQVSAQELRLIEVDRLKNAISEMLENLRLW